MNSSPFTFPLIYLYLLKEVSFREEFDFKLFVKVSQLSARMLAFFNGLNPSIFN